MIDYEKIYSAMLTGRILDEEMRACFSSGETALAGKYFYSGKGQEDAAAIAGLLRKDDYLFPHPYRGFTHVIAKGVPLKAIVGEYFGKKTGMLGGFGDCCGAYYPSLGVVGTSVILGGNFAIALGLALAVKKNNDTRIVAIFFGDGEASRSTFGSALNIAVLWQLPVLFICENNGLSVSTPVNKTSSTPFVAERGKGYSIRSLTFDGEKMLPMFIEVGAIIDEIRKSRLPMLIEVLTSPPESHFYAPELEKRGSNISKTTGHDSLEVLEKELLEANLLSRAEIGRLKKEVLFEVRRVIKEARSCPQPSHEEFSSFYHEF